MKIPLFRFPLFTALLALICTGSAARASEALSTPVPVSAVKPASGSDSKSPLLNFDFPGGSLAQLVTLINRSDAGNFNLIGETTDQAVPLPPFSLRGAEAGSLATALNLLLRPQSLTLSPAGPNIFVLTKSSPSRPASTSSNAPFQAFQLAPYLTTLSIENITDAIAIAWALDRTHDPKLLQFKFHPATKLLFVHGPPEAVALAAQVIPELNPLATVRARAEYQKSLPEVTAPTPAEEKARVEALSQEVARRRAEREQAGTAVNPPSPKK